MTLSLQERFHSLLVQGSRELYEDNPTKMLNHELLPTRNPILDADLALFFAALDEGLIVMERGARFNTYDRPIRGGRWGLLSRSKDGGWYNAEYLPQIAAYVDAILNLGYSRDRVLFELPDKALKLDLAILDDEKRIVVLGEAKRTAPMLDKLVADVTGKYGSENPGEEGRNESRQLAWRLWTTQARYLWLIGPDVRSAFAVDYAPLRLTALNSLPSAHDLHLGDVPGGLLSPPQIR